jgi:hypothetical protein
MSEEPRSHPADAAGWFPFARDRKTTSSRSAGFMIISIAVPPPAVMQEEWPLARFIQTFMTAPTLRLSLRSLKPG